MDEWKIMAAISAFMVLLALFLGNYTGYNRGYNQGYSDGALTTQRPSPTCSPWPGATPSPDAVTCSAGVEGQVPVYEVCCNEGNSRTCAKFSNPWDAENWKKVHC